MLGMILLFASCKKESPIGTELQNDPINLSTSDTTTLVTYTVREDSLRSDEASIVQVGEINDQIFGKTNAGVFTQVTIPNGLTQINFGTGSVLDSAVLCLSYDYDYYGDTLTPQTFNVYQVTEKLYKDSLYYSNHPKQYYPTAIGTKSFSPQPRTKTVVGTDTTLPHLRIPINQSFAQQLFAQSGGPVFADNSSFTDFMRGFYVTSESNITTPNQGSLMRFKMQDSLTRFILYYHDTAAKTFQFTVGSSTAYYNYFTHDYTGTQIATQLSNPGPYYNEVYVQGAGGVKTKIQFPYFDNWKNLGYKIAINKAELIIKADPSQATADFPVNKQLYVVYIDSAGHQVLLPDMFENSTYYGGPLNTTTNEYHINIARYFQQALNGDLPTNGLYLKEFNPDQEGRRAVLGSALSSTYKMYLHLVYTRVN